MKARYRLSILRILNLVCWGHDWSQVHVPCLGSTTQGLGHASDHFDLRVPRRGNHRAQLAHPSKNKVNKDS